jgi:hypothetical protein
VCGGSYWQVKAEEWQVLICVLKAALVAEIGLSDRALVWHA